VGTGLLVLALAMFPPDAIAQSCGNASLKGAYAYAGNGTITVAGRSITNSHVGRIVFDGANFVVAKAAVPCHIPKLGRIA
jgi:hypothetical protein